MGLNNNWDVHLGGTVSGLTPTFCDRCTRGGPVLRESRGFFPWGGVNTDSRKTVSGGLWFNLGFSDEGNSRRTSLDPYVNFRLSTNLQANLGLGASKDRNDSQWYGNFDDPAGLRHYSFAHLDQRTVSMRLRLNYTATPDLTFEFYGAPFVSTGTYSNVRELQEGLEKISALRAKRGEQDKNGTESYTRCLKALLAVGPATEQDTDHVLGFPLELIADTNPYQQTPGTPLPIRLLFEGQALEGALVEAKSLHSTEAVLTARTDAKGHVSFRFPSSGEWMLNAVHMVEAKPKHKNTQADWQSYWASLTFALPEN
jgi:hypothetical protein